MPQEGGNARSDADLRSAETPRCKIEDSLVMDVRMCNYDSR